jgi:hypothetical protein
MHAPGCYSPTQYARGHRMVAADTTTPRDRARLVLPALRDDWCETISIDFTIGATSQESVLSRLIYGPFRIASWGGRTGTAATNSMRLQLSVANTDSLTLTDLTARQNISREIMTDAATHFVGGLDLTTLWVFVAPNFVERGPLARVVATANNTSAGAQVVTAIISIVHLIKVDTSCAPSYA